MEYCSSCGKDVAIPQEKKQRRLLSSSTVQTVLQTLRSIICKLQRDQESLEDVRGGFICRSCVRLIERYNKVHEEVLSNVVKALPILRMAKSTVGPDEPDIASAGPPTIQQSNPSHSLPAPSTSGSTRLTSAPLVSISEEHEATDTGSPALTVINIMQQPIHAAFFPIV